MARAATSRRKNIPGFGWLTKKRETYHRDVAGERRKLKREALAERRERLTVSKLRAQEKVARARELAAEAKIKAAERKIATAEHKIAVAEKKLDKGGMAAAQFEAMKARMEREIEAQEQHKRAAQAKISNPAKSAAQYRLAQAVLSGTARTPTQMTRKVAQEIMDSTPVNLRSEYSRLNPNRGQSTEYRLAYNLGQADRQTAQLRKTDAELYATFEANFGGTSADWDNFAAGYNRGYGVTISNPELPHPRYADTAFEAGVETARMYKRINIKPDRNSFLTNFKAWQHQHKHMVQSAPGARRVDVSKSPEHLEQFTAGFRSEAAPHWSRNNPSAWSSGAWPDLYPTKAAAQAAWYDSMPGRNDHAAYKKVKGGGWQIVPRNASGRTNPGSDEYEQARKIAELFHGRPVKEEITVTEQIREHDWLWRIGPLISLKIRTLTKRSASLPFSRDGESVVHLFCSPDGRQFYLRGGDQELNLKPLGMGPGSDWYRDQMLIGEAKEITYRDKKKFHKFKLIDYYHKLGEKTKVKPMLAYDAFAHKMAIVGGQYKVETDDLVDGMSPGIVN